MVFYWANIKSENQLTIDKYEIFIHNKYFTKSYTLAFKCFKLNIYI